MSAQKSALTDCVLISHIILECQKITDLTARITYDDYLRDATYQDALSRRIEIIGGLLRTASGDTGPRHEGNAQYSCTPIVQS